MSNPSQSSGGPPLRALAMVLIALAIVFAGLGAMALSKSDSDATPVASATRSVANPALPTGAAASTAAAPATTTAAPTTTAAAVDKSVPVRVLNNSTVAGLAGRTGNQLTAAGWNVVETGNYAKTVLPRTTVYYGNSPSEKAVATAIAAQIDAQAEPRSAAVENIPAGVIVIVTGH